MNFDNPTIWLIGTAAVAVFGFISSAFGAWLSAFLTRRRNIEEENRNVRKDIYRGLYLSVIEMAATGGKQGDKDFCAAYNSVLFYAPDPLLKAVVKWKKEMDDNNGQGQLNSPAMKRVLDEMRKDLRLSRWNTISSIGFNPVSHNPQNKANKAVDSTATRVTPPASSLRSGQESRHGQP